MTPLDVHHIAQTITRWTGARYKNFYHDKEKVILQIHKENTLTLHITPTQIYQEEKGEMPEKPTPLAQSIRSNLEGTRLEKVEQIGTERILELTFKGRETTRVFVIELFSTGNVLLLDEKKKIIIAKTYKEWKDRSIKTGEQYKLPPQSKNILESTPQEIEKETTKNDDNIEKTIARTYGLGGEVAKIIVTQTIPPTPKNVLTTIQKMWKEQPPENSLQKRDLEHGTSNMGHGTWDMKNGSQLTDKNKEKTRQREKKKESIQKRITIQEERLLELQKEELENRRKGELIYENYERVKGEIRKGSTQVFF